MFRTAFIHGLVAGILAGIASLLYARIYTGSLGADFSGVISTVGIFTTCLAGCILASIAYYILTKKLGKTGEIIFSLAFTLLTFASIMGPFATTLPLEIEMPELFPGLTVPMHFFPALAWHTVKPIFPAVQRSVLPA